MTPDENIEKVLSNFLLKDTAFILNDKKIIRRGNLILFKSKDYNYLFTIKNNKNVIRDYELPYPFNYEVHDDHIIFDYSIDQFTQGDVDLDIKTRVQPRSKKNKLYNSHMILSAVS